MPRLEKTYFSRVGCAEVDCTHIPLSASVFTRSPLAASQPVKDDIPFAGSNGELPISLDEAILKKMQPYTSHVLKASLCDGKLRRKLRVLEAKKDGGMQEGYEGRKKRCQRSRAVFSYFQTVNPQLRRIECGEKSGMRSGFVACVLHYWVYVKVVPRNEDDSKTCRARNDRWWMTDCAVLLVQWYTLHQKGNVCPIRQSLPPYWIRDAFKGTRSQRK